jgi:hypothetical protein
LAGQPRITRLLFLFIINNDQLAMMKRAILIFCLLFSSIGPVSYAAEPSLWPVEISELHTPGADAFQVISDLDPVVECESPPPTGLSIQIPCYRYLLFEYQQGITVLWQVHQLRFITGAGRNTHTPFIWSRSDLDTPEAPSFLS